MSQPKPAVAAVIFSQSWSGEILTITRHPHLKAFPGHTAFPGGKVDDQDYKQAESHDSFGDLKRFLSSEFSNASFFTLLRELNEELGIDLYSKDFSVLDLKLIGKATTPAFNPFRFETLFFGIVLDEESTRILDRVQACKGEIYDYSFKTPRSHLEDYLNGDLLCVSPTLKLLESLAHKCASQIPLPLDLNLHYDESKEVPFLETLHGLLQLMPLSNTLPPAARTNAFYFYEDPKRRVLIDPSPRDYEELEKLKFTLSRIHSDKKLDGPLVHEVFISHHHGDHYEYSHILARELNASMGMSQRTFDLIKMAEGEQFFDGINVIFYKDGDSFINYKSTEVKVWHTPGHASGQISLACVDKNWVFAGDLFQTMGSVVIDSHDGNMKSYLQSLLRVIEFSPKFCFPSHGLGVGGTKVLERIYQHRLEREQQVLDYLNHNNISPVDADVDAIFEAIYAREGLKEKLRPFALETIKSHLKKIIDQAD